MTIENRKLRYYFVPPPLIGTYYKYQDVNNNEKLRKKVTTHFQKELLKKIKKDKSFSYLKSNYNFINSKDGYNFVYKYIRKFVKKGNTNWYDLRDDSSNHKLVLDYLKYKLGKY